MIMLSWYKKINFDHYSDKKQYNGDGSITYFRVTVSKLSFVWMDNDRARSMLVEETCPKFIDNNLK